MVPAPLLLAAVERGPAADRDERVLKRRAALVVGVDVTGRNRGDTEVAGELTECGVAAGVAPLVGSLELDQETVSAKRCCDERSIVWPSNPQPVSSAT